MSYSPYQFNRDDAFRFARHVNIPASPRGKELKFTKCPYCGQNTDDKNTFAINLDNGTFNCLRATCGAKGNMITLSRDFGFSLGNEVDEYYKPRRQFRRFKKPEEPIVPKDPAVKYLQSRGISERVARLYEITVQSDHENILVFPFYDENGELVFIKYRKTDFEKGKDKNKEWCEANSKPILFGMKQCNRENKTLILTEGQLDSLSVAEAGLENAVSVPTGAKGFTWVPYCWDFVNSFETLVVFGDHEKGRITLLEEIRTRFHIRVKHVREEDYLDCKDANDILRKYGRGQIKKCIENAIDLPVNHVISLADVEDINPFNIPKLPTGFKELDSLMYGGLPFGGITIITGKTGLGKSTVASQIIANAIDKGYKCFAYSGELPNHMFKSWLMFQVADNIIPFDTKWGGKGFTIPGDGKQRISEWFREKIYLYDSMSFDDEQESIVKTSEEMMMRYGVRVVLIDNMMTALDLEAIADTNKYERQSLFVKRLAKLAIRHDALILLVAHKRKAGADDSGNDEVAGSSDITNLGSVVLSYEQSKDLPKDQRLLKVTKNRLFGKIEPKGWKMKYDEQHKRVYGEHDEPYRQFGWVQDNKGIDGKEGFESADMEDIPF